MIGSVRVESVSVPVSDQVQAKEFYVEILGFELLVDDTWQAGMLPGMYRVLVLATDDIQAIYKELVPKGIRFDLPPTQTPRGTQAMFRDPDGNALLLWDHRVPTGDALPVERRDRVGFRRS